MNKDNFIFEFLSRTSIQRTAMNDQTQALIREEMPEMESTLDKTAEFIKDLYGLSINDPGTALTVIEAVENMFELFKYLATGKGDLA